MVFVGILLVTLSFSVSALVPVEGIILGEAQDEYQTDPLKYVFRDIYDTSKSSENKKLKFYLSFYNDGAVLEDSCQNAGPLKYASSWDEKQARRHVAATLQYLGLDTTIKAIGAYSHRLELSQDDFINLKNNLIKNYCSRNLTVFSLKTIEKSLEYYFKNPPTSIIPDLATSPFATKKIKMASDKLSVRSKEFDLVIKSFRSFCSWSGDVEDYRLLAPYLQNSFIMAEVIKNISGVKRIIDEKNFKVSTTPSNETVQVVCMDLICRKETNESFKKKFPMSMGTSNLYQDLVKNYCHHFKYLGPVKSTIPQISDWIAKSKTNENILETSQFISLITGIPDLLLGVENFKEISEHLKSSIDERWDQWAQKTLNQFSHDFMFEESLKIKLRPKSTDRINKISLVFDVTLGEMDRVVKDNDKLTVEFNLSLPKNYLRHLRSKWINLQNEVDFDGQKEFKKQTSQYVGTILKEKEKLFIHKIWTDELFQIIADELIRQVTSYEGAMFRSYRDEMLKIPVKFSYGLFALSFIKYRADVTNGRVKLGI
jgi:plasmid maintenance system antidote protein VapI